MSWVLLSYIMLWGHNICTCHARNYIPLGLKLCDNEDEDICICKMTEWISIPMSYLSLEKSIATWYMLEHEDIKFQYNMMRTPWFCVEQGMGPQFPWGNGGPVIFSWCVVISGLSKVTKCYNIPWTELCKQWIIKAMMTQDISVSNGPHWLCIMLRWLTLYIGQWGSAFWLWRDIMRWRTVFCHWRNYRYNIINSQLYTVSVCFSKKPCRSQSLHILEYGDLPLYIRLRGLSDIQ